MTWQEDVERQRAAMARLGIRGAYPYPMWWYIGTHRIKATTPTEAFSVILNTPIEKQIEWRTR